MNLHIMILMLPKTKQIAGHLFFPHLPVKFNYTNGAQEIYLLPPLLSCPYLPLSSTNALLHSLGIFSSQ